ncbi:hypothetical protein CR513_35038, partial [Mucuna pruriens]
MITTKYKVEREIGALDGQPRGMLEHAIQIRRPIGDDKRNHRVGDLFGERNHARSIPVLYMMVDVAASYNIIMGKPALNKLRAIVSTLHLCMKYPVGKEVGRIWADHRAKESSINALDLDLDPCCEPEHERPLLVEDLKEIKIGPSPTHKTRIGTTLAKKEESRLGCVRMVPNRHAWDRPRVLVPPPLSITGVTVGYLEEEEVRGGETKDYQGGDKCARITLTWISCPKDLYPLPNIDRLVDGTLGFALLSFMDAYSGYN